MFFFNAEKQGSYFETWSMRRFAVDTQRRHMYYTESEKVHHRDTPNEPVWKKKFKVTKFTPIATVHEFHLDDPHLKETDFFTMEIHGKTRALGLGEPPKEPLLCPFTGPVPFDHHQQQIQQQKLQQQQQQQLQQQQLQQQQLQQHQLQHHHSEDTMEIVDDLSDTEVRDPFQLCELYEALRDEFTAMHRVSTLRAVNSTSSITSQRSAVSSPLTMTNTNTNTSNNSTTGTNDTMNTNYLTVGGGGGGGPNTMTSLTPTGSGEYEVRTLTSPRAASAKERHIIVALRCQNESDFRQLWFVLQTILGYDKLDVRPYRGLPPYDPRNGLPFAHVPMHLWHTFMVLEKSVFYAFLRGDLVGRGIDGSLQVSIPGAYLCITHDMILVMRADGSIPRWVRLQDVHTFEYNTLARRPFFAFLTDDPAPDVLFIPRPPVFGPQAIASFSAVRAVQHVKSVLQDTCFLSDGIRRAITFTPANWAASVRHYCTTKGQQHQHEEEVEEGRGNSHRPLKFIPLDGFDNSLSCLIPKVQLAKVWREVIRNQRSRSSDDVAAIPLEGAAAVAVVNPVLSTQEISAVRQQMMGRQHGHSQDEIVGVPLDALLVNRRQRTNAALETPVIQAGTVNNNNTNNTNNTIIGRRQQESDEDENQEKEEVVYQQPGACYLRRDASLSVVQPNIADGNNSFGRESHVVELVNTSLVAIGADKMEK